MALPKEPRQKMINLMYLVLTALLALNVSAEIINAFKVVDNSLTSTNKVVGASTRTIIKSFEEKLTDPTTMEKAKIWKPKADQAVILTTGIYDYIEGLKMKLKIEAGFDPANPNSTFKEDNTNFTSKIFVKEKVGDTLLSKLTEYKKALLAIDPEIGKQFASSLPINLETPKLKNTKMGQSGWSESYFYMTPTVAALTMLSKFQNDVKTSENRLVNEFHNKVGQVVVRFDTYEPIIGANSTYLFPGQELQISAGIGAFSKNALPQITIGGRSVPLNEQGVAVYKTNVSAGGGGSVPVVIRYKDQDGKDQVRESKIDYTVGTPTGAFVSAEKVKVLYIGLDNELAVTGGSVGDEQVTLTCNNGSPRKIGPGRYIVNPSTPGSAVVTVNAGGKTSSFNFRVKTVPDPTPMVGQSNGGRIPASVFKAQQGIRADLKDFVFEGVTFTVTGYTMVCVGAGFPEGAGVQPGVQGNSFGPVQNLLQKCRPGTTVVIDEIKAVGPGGNTRKLQAMAFNLY
ncbi:MAG: gliding motility protein GldM [Chitinophagaceae bacterium]|nr:gliding motility protein GldM [Chitinophagaceae bacterium]